MYNTEVTANFETSNFFYDPIKIDLISWKIGLCRLLWYVECETRIPYFIKNIVKYH